MKKKMYWYEVKLPVVLYQTFNVQASGRKDAEICAYQVQQMVPFTQFLVPNPTRSRTKRTRLVMAPLELQVKK